MDAVVNEFPAIEDLRIREFKSEGFEIEVSFGGFAVVTVEAVGFEEFRDWI